MSTKLIENKNIPQWVGKRVMVVEDDFISYKIIEKYLRPTGVEIIWVKDGVEALQSCHKLMPDLALVDVRMPRLNGIDLTRKLKQLYRSLPIIIQTAYGLPEHQRECFNAGADAFIAKPFDKHYFFYKIRTFFN